MKIQVIIPTVIILLLCCCSMESNEAWHVLSEDPELSEWEQPTGSAVYTFNNNKIVGTALKGAASSFLCTREIYSDFILEFEVKMDTSLNSGVQIRSHSCSTYYDGKVFGYQVEIVPSPNHKSGGIYDENRRGWLYDFSKENPRSADPIRNNKWNKYRIEAMGDSIRVWVNGISTANLIDDFDSDGFIGLQLYCPDITDKPWAEGAQVQWRDVRIKTTNLKDGLKQDNQMCRLKVIENNVLTEKEKSEGWKLLFDGETTEGWRGVYKKEFPLKGWSIEDESIMVEKASGGESTNGGDIVTKEMFSDFDFSVDFKLTPGANSGIKYYIDESISNREQVATGYGIGPEFQIIDDIEHSDLNPNVALGSVYALFPPQNKNFFPPGYWNTARIKAKGNKIEHWLNGKKILEYERGSSEFYERVSVTKFKAWPTYGMAEKGPILFQDHGGQVYYRDIKIRVL